MDSAPEPAFSPWCPSEFIHDFWSSVKDAPNSIRAVTNDLNLLVDVLSDAAVSEEPLGGCKTTKNVLLSCSCYSFPSIFQLTMVFIGQDRVHDLLQITQGLEHGLASGSRKSHKWAAVKVVFKEDKIRGFKSSLEEIKTTLLLARQSSLE